MKSVECRGKYVPSVQQRIVPSTTKKEQHLRKVNSTKFYSDVINNFKFSFISNLIKK